MSAQRAGATWREAGVRKPAGEETAVGQESRGRIDRRYGDLGAGLCGRRLEGRSEAAILDTVGVPAPG